MGRSCEQHADFLPALVPFLMDGYQAPFTTSTIHLWSWTGRNLYQYRIFCKYTRFFSKNNWFFCKPHFHTGFFSKHTDFFPNSCRVHPTVLDCSVVCTHPQFLRIMIIGDWRRSGAPEKRTWKTTGFSSKSYRIFHKNYWIALQTVVWLDVRLRMSYRIFLQTYHVFLKK